MATTLIPIYPLVLDEVEMWRPTPEVYFLDDFLLSTMSPADAQPHWKIDFTAGSALWLTTARGSRFNRLGVITTGTIYLRYDGPRGHAVWRLTDESVEHLPSGERAMKGVWPD